MSKIKVISYEEATGRLKDIYDELITKRGKLADVHMIQSLRPESIVKHIDLYMEIMFSKSELSRAEREMMAVVVSASNGCEYCQIHHSAALNHYWKDENKVNLLRNDIIPADLNDRERALCEFATKLTSHPENSSKEDLTINLRNVGLLDSAILDATLVIAYFNFVNRIVLALVVGLENDPGEGYHY
ncbi:MAG: peroxidase-related enzyme [Candidatus Marinimicrobia bacterium]|nr:peroxidase-related enzyme [Candidatus Neomarinimicrobiota bacterium]